MHGGFASTYLRLVGEKALLLLQPRVHHAGLLQLLRDRRALLPRHLRTQGLR